MVDLQVDETGLSNKLFGFGARVILGVGRIELIVDGQAAVPRLELGHYLAHVAAERQWQVLAQRYIYNERQIQQTGEDSKQAIRQATREGAERLDHGEVK